MGTKLNELVRVQSYPDDEDRIQFPKHPVFMYLLKYNGCAIYQLCDQVEDRFIAEINDHKA
jgi:hypothetical protein